jgi:hypothetical protein
MKGEYYLRIGIHDLISDKIGALAVPVASIATVPAPLASSPSKYWVDSVTGTGTLGRVNPFQGPNHLRLAVAFCVLGSTNFIWLRTYP